MKRAERRHELARLKQKYKRLVKNKRNITIDEEDAAKMASVHASFCSCMMCGNPRKYGKGKRKKTAQELKHDDGLRDD